MFKEIVNYTNSLCGPAHIYFIFSIWIILFLFIKMLFSNNFDLLLLASRIATCYIITFILQWLCKKGWENFSWFLLGWLFVFFLIITVGVFNLMNKIVDKMKISCNKNMLKAILV